MAKKVKIRGKTLKLGVIHRRGKFKVIRRISPLPKKLGVELLVEQTTPQGTRKVGVVQTLSQAIRLIDKTQKRQKFVRKTKKRAKKLGLELGKGIFKLVEESTRPRKRKRRSR